MKKRKSSRGQRQNTETKMWIRVSGFEKNRLQFLADRYANGNLSAYLVYCGLNCPRKKLTSKDFTHSTRLSL